MLEILDDTGNFIHGMMQYCFRPADGETFIFCPLYGDIAGLEDIPILNGLDWTKVQSKRQGNHE